ncbi:MAG: hypothetical protein NVS1B13_18320 [Flavisolibacter sp.]
MKEKKLKVQDKSTVQDKRVRPVGMGSLFEKSNYKLMLLGIGILVLGFLLMAGGKSNDPNTFNPNEVYSFRRITIAPIFIVIGLVIEIWAIFKNPKNF